MRERFSEAAKAVALRVEMLPVNCYHCCAMPIHLPVKAILLSEDQWLSRLYPDQIKSITDYVRLARQIREVVGPLVADLLRAGVTVVLDFPANTPQD